MALEIERRFLVRGEQWRRHVRWSARLQQGYLAADSAGFTLRVRRSQPAPGSTLGQPGGGGEQAWLTLKAAPDGAQQAPTAPALVRHEFEYPIPPADAGALLALTTRQVSKWRHGLDLPGGDWVLDVFEAANAPLVVAEVELETADASLQVPPWCVLELTGRHGLSNAALASTPLARWNAEERQALLGWCAPGASPLQQFGP
jgi:adenylate cyclase